MAVSEPNVVALTSFVGRVGTKDVVVLAGEAFAKGDPIVKKWPHLFSRTAEPRVEQATAAPGEKRGA
jgi:hypothetical protein